MIKLTYATFRNQEFVSAVQKMSHAQLPRKVAYQWAKIVKAMEKAQKTVQDDWVTLIGQGPTQPGEDAPQEEKDKFNQFAIERFKTFGERETTIDLFRIPASKVEHLQFSANELIELEPFFEENTEASEITEPTETTGNVVTLGKTKPSA